MWVYFSFAIDLLYFQVMRAAEILAVDLLEESFLVPVLKTLLPSLSNAYQSGRLEEDPARGAILATLSRHVMSSGYTNDTINIHPL